MQMYWTFNCFLRLLIYIPPLPQVTFKSWILTSKKKGPSCPNWVQGFRWFGQCPKENIFFLLMSSLMYCTLYCPACSSSLELALLFRNRSLDPRSKARTTPALTWCRRQLKSQNPGSTKSLSQYRSFAYLWTHFDFVSLSDGFRSSNKSTCDFVRDKRDLIPMLHNGHIGRIWSLPTRQLDT